MIKVDADTVLSASDFKACALTFAYTRDCALTCTRAKELTAVSFRALLTSHIAGPRPCEAWAVEGA